MRKRQNYDELNDLKALISCAFICDIQTTRQQVTESALLVKTLFTRQLMNSSSLYKLFAGTRAQEFLTVKLTTSLDDDVFYDFASAACLLRPMYDTLVKMQFFAEPVSENATELRVSLFHYHAALQRFRFLKSFVPRLHAPAELSKELSASKARLLNCSEYSRLPDSTRKAIENDKLNDFIWPAEEQRLRQVIGIPTAHRQTIYKCCSEYLHVGAFAIQQLQAISSREDGLKLITPRLRNCLSLLATTIVVFTRVFPNAACVLKSDAPVIEKIKLWFSMRKLDPSREDAGYSTMGDDDPFP